MWTDIIDFICPTYNHYAVVIVKICCHIYFSYNLCFSEAFGFKILVILNVVPNKISNILQHPLPWLYDNIKSFGLFLFVKILLHCYIGCYIVIFLNEWSFSIRFCWFSTFRFKFLKQTEGLHIYFFFHLS